MIVGVAMSHAQHAADKVRQVQLPPSWNVRPRVTLPLHVAFISGDFRAHVTAHLLQVKAICAYGVVMSRARVVVLSTMVAANHGAAALLFPPIFCIAVPSNFSSADRVQTLRFKAHSRVLLRAHAL
jgi:hypothetical protein